MRLVGANQSAKVAGRDELPGKSNYFIGNDPQRWRSNVPMYAKLRYSDVYPGIDLVYYGNQGQLEYDFEVSPGADPQAITLDVETGNSKRDSRLRGNASPSGNDRHLRESGDRDPKLQIAANGDLVVETEGSEVRLRKPVVYQLESEVRSQESEARKSATDDKQRTRDLRRNSEFRIQNSELIDGRYVLMADNCVHFEIGAYDRSKPLVIDPVLSYSTFLGGTDKDSAFGIAVDSSGSTYVVGATASADFPTQAPLQSAARGTYDVFVTKLNSTGSALVYSTYIAGTASQYGGAIALDSSGDAYITGITSSQDFPTVGPFQGHCKSCPAIPDGFVAKLNSSGSALLYSTFLGGSDDDSPYALAVDSSGSAYVTGLTASSDFPTTPKALDTTCGTDGKCNADPISGGPIPDAFVTKLSPAGSSLAYSTFLGGGGYDEAWGLAVDASGNAFVAGLTLSLDFPVKNAFQATLKGNGNAFVTSLNAAGSSLNYSTYLGGSVEDSAFSVALDSAGNAYIAGTTSSPDFPTTASAFDSSCGTDGQCNSSTITSGPPLDGFVAEIGASGSSLVFSTFLGGSGVDSAYGIAVDSSHNVYVSGVTNSQDFPVVSPIQSGCHDCDSEAHDSFVAELKSDGSALIFSTYLGGNEDEVPGLTMALDTSGNIYVTGSTASPNFPVLGGAFQMDLAAASGASSPPPRDAFIAKISPANASAATLFPRTLNFGMQGVGVAGQPLHVKLSDRGSAALNINGIGASGDYSSTDDCGTAVSGGTDCNIQVTFQATAVGPRSGTLTITDSAPGSPRSVTLAGTGVNGSLAVISPSALDFDKQEVGTPSQPQTLALYNPGNQSLNISSLTVTGDFAQTNNCGATVASAASCALSITFTPAGFGQRKGSLTLADDAVSGSPQVIPLTGFGSAPVPKFSSAAVSFGGEFVGTKSAPQTISMFNSGSETLVIKGITVSGDFQETDDCGSSIGAGYGCDVHLIFAPQAVGGRGGTLAMADNAPGSPHTLPLSGMGTNFNVAVASGSSNSATVAAGQTAGYQLQIEGSNGLQGTLTLTCAGAPTGASCTVNPASATLNGAAPEAASVSVNTSGRAGSPPFRFLLPPFAKSRRALPLLVLLALAMLLPVFARRVKTPKPGLLGAACAMLLLTAAILVSCGGGAKADQTVVTPPGAYTLTVTATATSGTASLSHNIKLNLTVN